jgi:hypothetical protein
MAEESRPSSEYANQGGLRAGPYLARIVNHLDPSLMGGLEVTLLREQGNTFGEDTQTHVVRCAMPFFGYTGFEFMGQNSATVSGKTSDAYNDTQKSYGMWFVPPDVGVTVLVVFIDGDPAQGYWIGCVPARFANNMVPAIAGSSQIDIDKTDSDRYGITSGSELLRVTNLPVAEINRKLNSKQQEVDPDKIKKPVHPMADRFLEQGLLFDDVRGVTTSSARREAPSMVFGISTPGPLDKRNDAKKAKIGTQNYQSPAPVPVSRLGGTQFVMDDGDDRYVRETPAGSGPVKYIDVLEKKFVGTDETATNAGEPTIPYNEYFRVRTRTGHQILMHNSEDLIYIGNARGTTWVELTSNGKIDIYAQDSISIHTETDLNVFANRDINLEAGRNINMKSGGRLKADIGSNMELLIGADGKITVGANWDQKIGGTTKLASTGNINVVSAANNRFTSGASTHIVAVGELRESASTIHMNGELADVADVAEQVIPLTTHANPVTSAAADWPSTKYQTGTISSIMKRIPMHEPWPLHENQVPQFNTPTNTDRDT